VRPRFALPLAARNLISLIGITITTARGWVFLTSHHATFPRASA
jgi:hypothetical protein